jgi:tetratricopeptide (TPR) repeat protein
MFAVELVEPLNVAILPMAFLGLGLATAVRLDAKRADISAVEPAYLDAPPAQSARVARGPAGRIFTTLTVCAALFVGVTMVLGDAYLYRGTNSTSGNPFNLAAAKDADRLLPYWPDPPLEVAEVEAYLSTNSGPASKVALLASFHWTQVALTRDSHYPRIWTLLAGAEAELGSRKLAEADYQHALSYDRWYTPAFQGLGDLAGAEHDWPMAVHWYRLALETVDIRDPSAVPEIRGLLDGAERHGKAAAH